MRLSPIVLVAAASLALASCQAAPAPAGFPASTAAPTATPTPPAQPVAVATTTQLGSILADITSCAGATSATLMGPGDDPHAFAVSSEQVAQMVRAKLVVANGLGLEDGMSRALAGVKTDGGRVYEVAPALEPLAYADLAADDHAHETEAEHAAHADEHPHGTHDPHVWMDVHRMASAAKNVGAELAKATGNERYATCGAQVQSELEKVDAEVRAALAPIPKNKRVIVTDHESFNYFAKAYGFEVAGVVIPGGSTDGEPSSAALAALVKTMRTEKVSVIFSNTTVNPKLSEAVAREVGGNLKVVQLFEGSVGPAGSEAATYAGMMRTNARLIAAALA